MPTSLTINSAPKWTTARTLTLTGDVTGATALDGTANVSLATTVTGGSNPSTSPETFRQEPRAS